MIHGDDAVRQRGASPPVAATSIGALSPGAGLTLTDGGAPVALPERLGFEHGAFERGQALAHRAGGQ